MRHRTLLFLILAGSAALVLSGCGGSSSTTGSTASGGAGASGGTVQGQVMTTRSAAGEPVLVVLIQKALGIGVAEAQAGAVPLANATVELVNGSGQTVATTKTDANGEFAFHNVEPGTYTLKVNGTTVATSPIVVGAGDIATVSGTVTQNGTTTSAAVTVEAADLDVAQNDAQLGHAINIDNASSKCDLVMVLDKREQGMGWGRIAQDCDVHPRVIGLGRSNLSDAQLASAREELAAKGRGGKGGKGPKGPKKA